jgi:hypothetical protein
VDWESFYIENDGVISQRTAVVDQIAKEDYWRYLRQRDLDGPVTGLGIPRVVFETSNGGYGISPSPNAAYTLKYKYFIKTITLNGDSDVCTIPTEYNYVIEDGALEYMYLALDNTPRADLHKGEFKKGLQDMTYILIPKSPTMRDTVVNFGGRGHFDRDFMWPYNT